MASRKVLSTIVTNGVDVGNGFTKINDILFPSKVKQGVRNNIGREKEGVHYIEFNGEQLVVGEGYNFVNENRYFEDKYLICLLTAIVLNTNKKYTDIKANVCIGVPVEDFTANNRELPQKIKKYFEKLGQQTIKVDDRPECTVEIEEMTVFIEGALPILTGEDGKVITIDIGSGTLDVTEFTDLVPTGFKTYPYGMKHFYNIFSTHLKDNNINYDPVDCESVFTSDTATYKTKTVDISFMKPLIQNEVDGILSIIGGLFKFNKADKIYLIGGGAVDTVDYWRVSFKKQYGIEGIDTYRDSQFVNCEVYESVLADDEE